MKKIDRIMDAHDGVFITKRNTKISFELFHCIDFGRCPGIFVVFASGKKVVRLYVPGKGARVSAEVENDPFWSEKYKELKAIVNPILKRNNLFDHYAVFVRENYGNNRK